jgi:transcriptional regulator with XRE-family HTH domain
MMTFIHWLTQELETRGWSQRELARRSGLSSAQVSSVLNNKRTATWDFCAAVALAMGFNPIDVFRRAGLMGSLQPGLISAQLTTDEYKLVEYYRGLEAQGKQYLLYAVSTLPQK